MYVVGYIRGRWLPAAYCIGKWLISHSQVLLLLPLPNDLKIHRAFLTDEIEGT
jgi:hypothetical protein